MSGMKSFVPKKLIDIGANLTDEMFSGIYNGHQKHEPDLNIVLKRAFSSGNCHSIIVTGTDWKSSAKAAQIASENDRVYCTVGTHPTHCGEFENYPDGPTSYLQNLRNVICSNRSKVAAIGEIGLDYDRLKFCHADTQRRYFDVQLNLAVELNLPVFLHCRGAAHHDLMTILHKHFEKGLQPNTLVVHSFTGTGAEADEIISMFINGCSLKTEDNLHIIKKHIPIDRIVIETDAPWCEIKRTHASYTYVKTDFDSVKKERWNSEKLVKGRNEPCKIIQVAEVLSGVFSMELNEFVEQVFLNTHSLFSKLFQ